MINKKEKGFTLIELLVAIAIIGILAGILITGMSKAKQKANQARAWQSFNQIALAMQLYYDKINDWPNPTGGGLLTHFWTETAAGYDINDRPGGINGFEDYPTWDATYYCSDCKYKFYFLNFGGDIKPDCGYIQITGTGVSIWKYFLCITSVCGSRCGMKNFWPK